MSKNHSIKTTFWLVWLKNVKQIRSIFIF